MYDARAGDGRTGVGKNTKREFTTVWLSKRTPAVCVHTEKKREQSEAIVRLASGKQMHPPDGGDSWVFYVQTNDWIGLDGTW